MPALPAGTVTFVFTDIEDSTALMKSLAEAYGGVLGEHRRLVRETFGAAGETEIDTQGDAFFYAFPRAREAVAASVDVQRAHAEADWPGGASVRVRIGLHTGEPAVGEEGYLGLDVVRAARICTVARGGNVLISETTRALLGSKLPDGVSVFPLGERHLKGLDEPERIYELEIAGVPSEHPEPEPEPSAPAPPKERGDREKEFERRMQSLGYRVAESIQERVLRSLEKSLGPSEPSPDDADLDDIAARFEKRILARVDEALKSSGASRDET